MKTLNLTIIAFVALSLLAAGFASANNVPDVPVLPVPAVPPAPAPAPVPAVPEPPTLSAVSNNLYSLTTGLSYGSRTSGSGTVLVIPSGRTNAEELLKINEDMNVMSRILDKNLEQNRISAVRSSIFVTRQDAFANLFGAGGDEIQSMYLQGFGALFMLQVDFPLSPAPNAEQEEKTAEQQQEGDPVWQQMRREMYDPQHVDRRHRTDKAEVKYDSEKVENLKTSLIKALKHAVNIRSLQQDESVILTVTGSSEAAATTITAARLYGENKILIQERTADGNTRSKIVQGDSLDNIGLSSPTVLVIRTKKSDITEFAKGDLNFDEFRKRVQLLTYPLLGGSAGHGEPYGLYMGPRSTGSTSTSRGATGSSSRR